MDNEKRLAEKKHLCVGAFTTNYENLINYNSFGVRQRPIDMEVLEFMHILMDECTHLVNYDIPFDTSMVHILTADDDAYVLRDGVNDFKSIWSGVYLAYI